MFEKHTTVATRLEQYRELRTSKLSKDNILEQFSEVKPRSRYIDYWTPKSWPKPFEIINIPLKHSRADNPLLRGIFRKIKSRIGVSG